MAETGAGLHSYRPSRRRWVSARYPWSTGGEGVSSSVFYTIGSPGPLESPLQARLTEGSQV